VWPPGSADTVCPRLPLTLPFDRLTLKLVCESHLRWRTFLPNLDIGLCVLEFFAMYATDGQTDGQTDGKKQRLLPLPYGRGHNKCYRRLKIKIREIRMPLLRHMCNGLARPACRQVRVDVGHRDINGTDNAA